MKIKTYAKLLSNKAKFCYYADFTKDFKFTSRIK